MAFDQTTRNRLNRFVGEARALLTEEFGRQLQSDYGIDPGSGRVDDVAGIVHLDDRQRETARILRDTLHHYMAGKEDKKTRIAAIDRILREQAFTVLNRLAALRMMEARGLLIPSIAAGTRSDGFQLYQELAGVALGETDEAYITYLFSLFDEFAVDLPVLFDRFSPQGRLFPSVAVLRRLLGLINDEEIVPLWAEDETIGWIYQYFNSSEERRQMRKASSAPRNSRELAVRNQFFTPRYVVEFLTDNTLGRIWYEMTKGDTRLVDECDYLVRRPRELFMGFKNGQYEPEHHSEWLTKVRQGDFSDLPDRATEEELIYLALSIDGYTEGKRLGYGDLLTWAGEKMSLYDETGELPDSAIELWLLIFAMQREHRIITGSGHAAPEFLAAWQALYQAWQDAMQRDTSDMSQEELLQQPVFIPHRPLKDPREIKLLDPACGSMHFGLYAFDLFETIYEEAWDRELLGEWAADYRDKNDFLRDVPRLIIERNIHGIDIDARAVQIAGLSLWLRAQRSWQEQGVQASNRPVVTRSNVVVAEPMPGDESELEAFLGEQFGDAAQDQIVAALVRRVFGAMKLAGEAGSLLKIEEEIVDDIEAAKAKWTAQPQVRQASLFERMQQVSLAVESTPVSDEQFWDQVEARIYAALQHFAEQASQGEGYRRRLFAEDTARGFAFVDICRQRYDVALMNPPFGPSSTTSSSYIKTKFPETKLDLYACFVERWLARCADFGMVGAITNRTFLTLSSYEQFRGLLTNSPNALYLVADLGSDVLDSAMVETAAFVVGITSAKPDVIFIAAHAATDDKKTSIHNHKYWKAHSPALFQSLPKGPFAYWLPKRLLELYQKSESIEDTIMQPRAGLQTSDDFRFARLWWEVVHESNSWKPFAKGGAYSPFWDDIHLLVNWRNNAAEMRAFHTQCLGYSESRLIRSEEDYFKPGLNYPWRTSLGFAPRVLPEGCVFAAQGSAILPKSFEAGWEERTLLALACFNSTLFNVLISIGVGAVEGAARSYQVGQVQRLPWPNELTKSDESEVHLASLAKQGYESRRIIDTFDETTRTFHATISPSQVFRGQKLEEIIATIAEINEELNAIVHVESEDLAQLAENIVASGMEGAQSIAKPSDDRPIEQIAMGLGSVMGRWDIRYATGELEPPPLPEPFEPLPLCPPGMLQNAKGLPAVPEDVPVNYPLRISWSGILVDDDGHPEDIVGRVREALHVIGGEKADDIEAEASSLLGVDTLREFFGNPNKFFDDHLSRYSKSRRYAPIYWPLTTTNGSYTLWLYYHRLDDNILYRCVNDFVDPKLAAVERQLHGLRNRKRDRDEERELEELTDLAVELETFRNDLLELARFWRPNLNDGVEITAAPLYALFGNRKWRNRLEKTWDKLQEGEYDWAHLAMSIWPSRVVPKCVEDRSLAIAHDIEKLFWVEEDENWRPLRSPSEEEVHQVEIRQSEERERLRDLLADLAADEGRYLPAMQVWQSLDEGEWDHRPLGLHLYPERAAEAAFEDATDVYHNLTTRGQKLLQKDTKKNKRLLTKRLVERGTPELIEAVEATLANEPEAFVTLWQALESGKRDDLPLALELWPERVMGKAQNDPDLAATHGLFDFFWYDEPGRGVRRRKTIRREIANEVERRGGDRGDGGRL